MKYFIIDNNEQRGPFTIDELYHLHITSETLVWNETMTDWTPAWKVQELKYILEQQHQSPTPPTFNQPDNSRQSATPHDGRERIQGQGTQSEGNFTHHQQNDTLVKKKDHSKTALLACIVGILLIALFSSTCPNKKKHTEAIKSEITSVIDKIQENNDEQDLFSMGFDLIAKTVTSNLVNTILDQSLQIKSYILFNKGVITFNGEEHTVSYGLLGHVFTVGDEDILKALDKDENGETENAPVLDKKDSDKQSVSENKDTSIKETDKDDKNLSSVGKELKNKVITSVGDRVKEKIQEDNDSTTSSGINRIVDAIMDFLKGS
ncbi:DUF4339 domain-containing protein [Segatella buccae]|uniref:DUF4339 domain-containing protein n=1 Tax=Segatella buccae TaxID=28126 RepID=UPI0028E93A48|nr:DUF4339 domain-containing protein [Segatella buccae]